MNLKRMIAWILAAAMCMTVFAGIGVMADEAAAEDAVTGEVVQDIYDYLWEIPEDASEEEYIKLMNRNFQIIQAFELLFTEESYDAYTDIYKHQFKRSKSLEDAQKVVEAQALLEQKASIADGAWFLWGTSADDNVNGYEWFTANVGPIVDGEETELTEDVLDTSKKDGYGQGPVLIKCLLEDPSEAKGNVILISGGGFVDRSNPAEGYAAIPVFQKMGYNCFLLQRRVAPYSTIDIFMDLQRAIRIVKNAAEMENWGGQDMIAAAGFSGGGGTILGTINHCYGDLTPLDLGVSTYVEDEIDSVNSDLDVAMIIYGAAPETIGLTTPDDGGEDRVTYKDDAVPVTPENENWPAFYICHGMADDTVPVHNAEVLYDWVKDTVPAQLYLVPDAKHGFGPGTASNVAPGCSEWTAQADEFMQSLRTADAADEAEQMADNLAAEFLTPPDTAKPGIRYWLPGAAAEEAAVREDMQNLAALGYGRVEVCSLKFFTSIKNFTETDQWGTERWDGIISAITDECSKLGMIVDINNGDAYPIQMPSVMDADDPASAYEVTFAEADVAAGQTYNDVIPERRCIRKAGTPKLLSAYAYKVVDEKTLDADGIIDLMDFIAINEEDANASTLNWTAPEDADYKILFTFEQPIAGANGSFTESETGPYIVDHFSLEGAQAAIDYWTETFEAHPDQLYISNIFTDSIEVKADKHWTRNYRQEFIDRKGYDIVPYLAVLGNLTYYNQVDGPGYDLTDGELTMQVRNDFRDVLTQLYEEYQLKPFMEFAESLGLGTRAQVGYNSIPTDMVSSALYVNIPETEGTDIDALSLHAAAVHNTDGEGILSIETGFEDRNNYGQTYEDILWKIKRAWAAGLNMEFLHGASYAGDNADFENGMVPSNSKFNGSNVNWPGYSAWARMVSNIWNQNTDEDNVRDIMAYIARTNYVMQKDSRRDLAIFREEYVSGHFSEGASTSYNDKGLLKSNGYSYDYVDTQILQLPSMTVTDGVLNAAGTGYKALILNHQAALGYKAAEVITALVQDGLPLVIVGEAPSQLAYYGDVALGGHSDEDLAAMVNSWLEAGNVKLVESYEEVPAALTELGVTPDVSYEEPADIAALHQTDANGEYYFLYNYKTNGSYPALDRSTAMQELDAVVTLTGEGKPYAMNAWSGELELLPGYEQGEGCVTVPLHFDRDEVKLLAVLTDEQAAANGLDPNAVPVVKSAIGDPIAIENWTLTIHSIHQGDTLFWRDSAWTELDPIELTELKAWADIDEDLADVSGIGTYTATITCDHGWDEGFGAWLNVGQTGDTYSVYVNGMEVPHIDQTKEIVDIGPYLAAGDNEIEIRVATTLYNVIYHEPNEYEGYGLLGTDGVVTVIPYEVANE